MNSHTLMHLSVTHGLTHDEKRIWVKEFAQRRAQNVARRRTR
jgi:hypothetical protein